MFIQHAKERMAERGISEDEVLDVVINFTVNRPGNTPNRARVEKMTNRGYLAVVIEPKIDKIEVVTAFRPRV